MMARLIGLRRQLASSGLALSAFLVTACGAASDSAPAAKSDAGASTRQCYGANDCSPGQACNEYGFCVPMAKADAGAAAQDSGTTPLPPEVETRSEPPASGKRYVYVAVPEQDMVAKIDSVSLQVRAVKVGADPGALRTIKGEDVAVVLNRLAASATVLRSRADGSDELVTLKTVAGLNQLALAPDGKHGIATFDVTLSGGALPAKQPLQEVTLLRLEAGKEQAINLPVGFRPSAVQFTADGSRGFVITEQGVSILDLAKITKPGILPSVPLLKDPLKEPKPTEVLVTPDGKLALLRQPGVKGIRAVELATKAIIDLPLAAEPTDLDLTPDGALAVAVLRDAGAVVLIDLPGDLTDPAQLDTLSTGSYTAGQAELTADGKHAFLFSNATTQEVLLTADLVSRALVVYPLKKGVRGVLPAPDGRTALILHNRVPGAPSGADGVEGLIDKSWAYSLLSLETTFVKLQLADADPGQVAFAPDSLSAYLLLSDTTKNVRAVDAIDLESFLIDTVTVGSPPVAVGVVPATQRVYVAQSHPLGRVTFLEQGTHATKTVTGFELNSYVIE